MRIKIAQEGFHVNGLEITARNFLEVYPYEKWSEKVIPNFTQGENHVPSLLTLDESSTSAPEMLTEADLIGLMDANSIGTDATIHEHIKKIQEREYVIVQAGRFYPTNLGVGLFQSYEELEIELFKPDLRRKVFEFTYGSLSRS